MAVAAGYGALSCVVFEPLRSNMDYGQINWILMVLVVLDLTTVTGKRRGTLIGVAAAIKLTPLIYLGYFLVQRQWRALIRGVSVFVGLTLIACLVLQVGTLSFWHDLFFKRSHAGATDGISNQSWSGLLFRSPLHGGAAAFVLWVPLVLVTVVAGLLLTRRLLAADRVIDAVVALALTELLVSLYLVDPPLVMGGPGAPPGGGHLAAAPDGRRPHGRPHRRVHRRALLVAAPDLDLRRFPGRRGGRSAFRLDGGRAAFAQFAHHHNLDFGFSSRPGSRHRSTMRPCPAPTSRTFSPVFRSAAAPVAGAWSTWPFPQTAR